MESINDILVFRLYGDGIHPDSFRSKDVGEIIASLDDALRAIVLEKFPEFKEDEVFSSIVQITDESLGINLKAHVVKIVTAFVLISTSVSESNFSNLPTKTIESLRDIQSKIKKYNCASEFKLNNQTLAHLSQDTEIKISENVKISGDTVVYGKVVRVGGSEPKVRIESIDGSKLICDVSEELAKEIAKNLYKIVGFEGIATWNKRDFTMLSFNIEKIIPYQESSNKLAFQELSTSLSQYWNKIDDIDEFLLND